MTTSFEEELTKLINRHSIENQSDTPDFILAQYVRNCLHAYNVAVLRRDKWYGEQGLKKIGLKP